MWHALTESVRAPRRPAAVPRRATTAVAVLAGVFALLDTSIGLNDRPTVGAAGPHAGIVLQLLVDASLPLLVRFPRWVVAFTLVVTVAMLGSDLFAPGLLVPLNSISPLSLPRAAPLVITVLVLREDRRFALCTVAIFAVLAGRLWHPTWEITPFGLLSTVGPALGALYFDARKQLLQSLRDRANRAEREKHLLAEQARFEERRRLAAEMHDVVTHRLSLIVLHADALRLTSRDEAAQKAAEDIRESGTQALQELRDLVGVLRRNQADIPSGAKDADARTQPVPDLDTLVAESNSVGIPVELETVGEPAQVSPTVARTAYRVVQEALTNVRKHAPGSKARVELRYGPNGVDVSVTNTAPSGPPDEALAGSGSGTGLAGLRHRVELVGGTLRNGPADGGGYVTSAILPAFVPTTESRHDDSSRPR